MPVAVQHGALRHSNVEKYLHVLVHVERKIEFYHLLLQVLFVGMTVGLFRTVIPVLASSEFGIPADSFLLIGTFVTVFGLIKAFLNFVAGRLADKAGRRNILLAGWIVALPIPYLLAYAQEWAWVLAATVLLGVNQGLCWSMSQTMKLDLAQPRAYGVTVGLNETFGYCGVAASGYASAVLVSTFGMESTMLTLGFAIIGLALLLGSMFCNETRAATDADQKKKHLGWKLFYTVSWHHRSTMALCLAGLVEKFVDTLIWLIYPTFLYQKGVSLPLIGAITGIYALVWGLTQTWTGIYSDLIGRKRLIVGGMLLCAVGCVVTLWSLNITWWIVNAVLIGLGMAMLYPTLSAAISDRVADGQRATVLGIYRFWRDFGYFIGAIALSGASVLAQTQEAAFYLTGVAMLVSALLVLFLTPETRVGGQS